MLRNGYVIFIQGGEKYGVILDCTYIIEKYLGKVHDRDPKNAKFETQRYYVFHTGFSCYKSLEKLLPSTVFCLFPYQMMGDLFKKMIKPVWDHRVA